MQSWRAPRAAGWTALTKSPAQRAGQLNFRVADDEQDQSKATRLKRAAPFWKPNQCSFAAPHSLHFDCYRPLWLSQWPPKRLPQEVTSVAYLRSFRWRRGINCRQLHGAASIANHRVATSSSVAALATRPKSPAIGAPEHAAARGCALAPGRHDVKSIAPVRSSSRSARQRWRATLSERRLDFGSNGYGRNDANNGRA